MRGGVPVYSVGLTGKLDTVARRDRTTREKRENVVNFILVWRQLDDWV